MTNRRISILESKFSKIVHVDYPSLITSSTFVIPTQGVNNKGHPHTLEHLVFLGSKKYPFKGILDVLANQCYANGTNAWTDVDHTAYTLDTVSWEGLHVLLPVYYDHILHPTMTDAAYTTEVHHITPGFKDAGVVYCEMEARENSAQDILQQEILNLVYPSSPYNYECGGLTNDIQQLTIEEIREYHAQYYHPKRTLLIICGTYPTDKLNELLINLDTVAQSVVPDPLPVRAWSNVAIKPLSKSIIKEIEFPDQHEDTGNVSFSWLANDLFDNTTNNSISMLLIYLTDSSASLIQHYFTEAHSLCSDVSANIDYRKVPNYYIICSDVAVANLHEIESQMTNLLKSHVVDFNRLQLVLVRIRDQLLYDLENKPYECYMDLLIPNFLYYDESKLLMHTDPIADLTELINMDASYWQSILLEYFINRPVVCIIQKPSQLLNNQIKSQKESRNTLLSNTYKDKKQSLIDNLASATKYNERPVPDTIFKQFPFFSINIKPHQIMTARLPKQFAMEHNPIQSNLEQLDTIYDGCGFFQSDVYASDFTTIQLWINTSNLTPHQKNLLPLLNSLFFNCELLINDQIIDLTKVVDALETDVLDFNSGCGVHGDYFKCGYFGEYLLLSIRSIEQNALKSADWLFKNLFNLHLNPIRIASALEKLKKDLSNLKRDGAYLSESLFYHNNYKSSNKHHLTLFHQHHQISTLLVTEYNKIEHDLLELLQILQKSHGICHYQGNENKVIPVYKSMKPFTFTCPPALQIVKAESYLDLQVNQCILYAPKGIDSSYLQVAYHCQIEQIDKCKLGLTLEVLEATEGPFWTKIRGAGLAYGTGISKSLETSLLELYISECNDPYAAYMAAKNVIMAYIADIGLLTDVQLQGGKSSMIYSQTRQEKTLAGAANKCFQRTVLTNTSKDRLKEIIKELPGITREDILMVLKKYVMPLFSKEATISIVLQQAKLEQQKASFESLGVKCSVQEFPFDKVEDTESEWNTGTDMSD